MRIAICIAGFLRTFRQTKASLLELIHHFEQQGAIVDVYLRTYHQNYYHFAAQLPEEYLTLEEIQALCQGLPLKALVVRERSEAMPHLLALTEHLRQHHLALNEPMLKEITNLERTDKQMSLVTRVLDQLVDIEACDKMRQDSGLTYDWVMKTRFDVHYLSLPPPCDTWQRQVIYCGSGGIHPQGICKTFPDEITALGDPDTMALYSQRVNYALQGLCKLCAHETLAQLFVIRPDLAYMSTLFQYCVVRSPTLVHYLSRLQWRGEVIPPVRSRTFGFIVPTCLRTQAHLETYQQCIQALQRFHPDSKIVVILDPSSTLNIPSHNSQVTVRTYTGEVAADMMMYDFFYAHHDFEIACFLQDSMILKSALPVQPTMNHLAYLWSFTNHRVQWDTLEEPPTPENILKGIRTHTDLIRDCLEHDVAHEAFRQYALTYLNQKDQWIGCFGLLSVCTYEFVTLLHDQIDLFTTMRRMGTYNRKRRAIESIFSLAVSFVLQTFDIPVLDGLYYDGQGGGHGLESTRIKKISHNREAATSSAPPLTSFALPLTSSAPPLTSSALPLTSSALPTSFALPLFPLPLLTATGDSHSILFLYLGYVTEHYLGFNTDLPLTMHRCGTEGLNLAQIPSRLGNGHERFPIKPGDTVIYCYGYNDIQYRVFEQTATRSLEDVLTTLVQNYIQIILHNQVTFQVQSCIYAVLPPPSKPIIHTTVGSVTERIHATQRLNALLAKACLQHHLTFLDLSPQVTDTQGTLSASLSSDGIHLDKEYVGFIDTALRSLFDTRQCSVLKRDVESFDRGPF